MVKFFLYCVLLALGGCLTKADYHSSNNHDGNNYLRETQHNNENDLIIFEGSRLLQQADENVSCAYYMMDWSNFSQRNVNYPPQEACGDNLGPAKCCMYDARLAALNGEGLFQVEYASDYLLQRGEEAASEAAANCYAYVDNLQDTVCSRNQGTFITDDTFSICQSSCDAVYEACVTEGIVDSSFATDGTSFCENAWVDQCTTYPDGYFCTQGITLSVVDATEGCAIVDTPTEDDIEFYQQHSQSLDACVAAIAFIYTVVGMWVLIISIIVIVICCCCIIACVCCSKK